MNEIIPDLWYHISEIMRICKTDPRLVEAGIRLRVSFRAYRYNEMASIIKKPQGVRWNVPWSGLSPEDKALIHSEIEKALVLLHANNYFGAI